MGIFLRGGPLGGNGFTMAIFIAGLALEGQHLNHAKIGIMIGSLINAVLGMLILFTARNNTGPD